MISISPIRPSPSSHLGRRLRWHTGRRQPRPPRRRARRHSILPQFARPFLRNFRRGNRHILSLLLLCSFDRLSVLRRSPPSVWSVNQTEYQPVTVDPRRPYFGNSPQASTSEPQYSTHFA